ncbi:prepilin peptidase [Patescibacteria group bacterium]|nr:prepilin peptidase [Patescibacteria group bacterium]MCL5114587.1 prepilin peptidase [Patescibacteria group bacterium]
MSPTPVGYLLLFILGLAFGSFFNVLILRYSPEGPLFDRKRLSGRSHCPKCLHELGVKELIPVLSFLFLGGKCSHCGQKISWFYPFTELATAILFTGVPYFLNSFYGISGAEFWSFTMPLWYYLLVVSWLAVALTFLLIALIDFRYYVVPDELNILLIVFGAIVSFLLFYHMRELLPFRTSFLENYVMIFASTGNVLANHLIGALGGGIFFELLVLVSRGRGIGFGDVKLAFASGIAIGWPDIGLAVFISFVLGGILGSLLLLFKRKGMKDRIPYAPFFVTGVFLTALFGQALVYGYFKLFGM